MTDPNWSAFLAGVGCQEVTHHFAKWSFSQRIASNKQSFVILQATSHLNEIGVASNGHKSSQLLQSHNFSICEATNTMLETAG
jgi:hypothetical protein